MFNFDVRFIARYYVSNVAVSAERSGARGNMIGMAGRGEL